MMLSRVAERLYWQARYLERAENTARLISAYSHLVLDIPRGVEPGWNVLLDTFDASAEYEKRYRKISERNVIKFLLAVRDNTSSITSSISFARENVRTTRDVLPSQAWELVNELFLFVTDQAEHALARTPRFEFLEKIIASNQQINGLIRTSVSHDHVLWFIELGQFMERADMTSRIVDVATATIESHNNAAVPEVPLLWANLLKSLSATAAYRRQIGPILTPDVVVDFVLKQPQFPRSIAHSLDHIEETVAHLKAPTGMLHSLRSIHRLVTRFSTDMDAPERLHRLIDKLQLGLADLDLAIHEIWFGHEPE